MTLDTTMPPRPFNKLEAVAFLSKCFPTETWAVDNVVGVLTFTGQYPDRDKFEKELQWFAQENDIHLDYAAFEYKTGPIDGSPVEGLTVQIPYRVL